MINGIENQMESILKRRVAVPSNMGIKALNYQKK
jgi:hypothetical protein